MTKKVIFFLVAAISVISISFVISYNQREITPEEAIIIAKNNEIENGGKETILNFDNPEIEEVIFEASPSIAYFGRKTDVSGKPLYKVTFRTEQDGLLGPIVLYIKKAGGKVIGADYRFW